MAPTDDRTDDRIDAWRALLTAHAAAVSAIEDDLEAAGSIPLSWYDVLLELNAAPDRRFHMQELAERVVLSRSRVSRIVDELEKAGFVERARCPKDGRAWHALLTEEGRAALKETAPRYFDAIEEHFTRHLADRERDQIVTALEKVRAAHER